MLHFYFIRHAESEANANNHLICGRSDQIPLSQRGWIQARQLAGRLKAEKMKFDQIFSSVSLRATQTAEVVGEVLAFDPGNIQQSDQLVELSKGEWEGEVRKQIYTPAILRELQQNHYDFSAPGGESQRTVEERMYQWLIRTKELYLGKSSRIAVFSHGFAIKTLFIRLSGADTRSIYRTVTHNTSLNGLQYDGSQWLVERLNDHAHLAGTEFVGHYW